MGTAEPRTQDAVWVEIGSLRPYKGNARIGNIGVIRESLRTNGQYKPVVVRTKTREVLAGNHTWKAAREEGWEQIWAVFVDCDVQTARRINLVDNRAPELGGYDTAALAALLTSAKDLTGTGWTDSDRDRLTSQLVLGVGGDTEPRECPPDPQTKLGDFYELGGHRLLCGSCADSDAVAKLFGERLADCMWTDPPFGTGPENWIPGNDKSELKELLDLSFGLATGHLVQGAAVYVMHPGNETSVTFGLAFKEAGWRLRQTLVWLKESDAMGWHDYHYKHELILFGYTAGGGYRGRGSRQGWYGGNDCSSVLEFSRPPASVQELHPIAKSVEMVEVCLINSAPKDGLVYEPFCGSGTALIAAQNVNRRCLAMEIDPGYCDVIVDRWERHTGLSAQKL